MISTIERTIRTIGTWIRPCQNHEILASVPSDVKLNEKEIKKKNIDK